MDIFVSIDRYQIEKGIVSDRRPEPSGARGRLRKDARDTRKTGERTGYNVQESDFFRLNEEKGIAETNSNCMGRSKVTAILGPRQCGKTTIAKEIAICYKSSFLDLESPSDRARLQAPEIYLKSLKGLIIIDEIQLLPELFPIIRVLSDQHKENGRFLILGRASPDLVKNTSESLAGRVEFVDLHGFSLKETGKEALKDLGLSKLYIIYPGEEHYPINESIEAIPLPGFLEMLNNRI